MGLRDKMPYLFLGMVMGKILQKHQSKGYNEKVKSYGEKWYEYFQLMNRWMSAVNEGKSIANYFEQHNILKIAVYGVGDFANRLSEELEGSEVQLLYGIDRDVSCTNSRIAAIYFPDEDFPEVDAIVITPFLLADEIKKKLRQKTVSKLISLDTIIYSM